MVIASDTYDHTRLYTQKNDTAEAVVRLPQQCPIMRRNYCLAVNTATHRLR